jgi:hypothetical protein
VRSANVPGLRGGERDLRSRGCRLEEVITLLVLPLILSFAPIAVWALRVGGLRRLWLLCTLALLFNLLAALVLSVVYSVPSTWQVVYYSLAFVGPSILLTTIALSMASASERALSVQLTTAFAGSMIGLGFGFVVVVYLLGMW